MDGGWYLGIASSGYELQKPESTAFFPLFPMLIRLGADWGGKPALWGVRQVAYICGYLDVTSMLPCGQLHTLG
jgi:hypothetical protein